MKDEPEDLLLSELADLAREEDGADKARFDERWDRLAAGTLTPEEEAELRALAETSPEAREAWEAFQPLGPEFQARVVERIAAELPKGKWGRLLHFPPAVRIGGWVTAAAAAAALFVVLRPSAPLPGYAIASISGGASEMRGEQEEIVRSPGDRFEMILQPDTAVTGAKSLEARSFLVRDGEWRPVEARSHFEPNGVVKLEGSIADDLQPGAWTLWAVVGRAGELPDLAELQSLSAKGEIRQRNWVGMSKDIRIQPRAP